MREEAKTFKELSLGTILLPYGYVVQVIRGVSRVYSRGILNSDS